MNHRLNSISHVMPMQRCENGEDVKDLADIDLLAIVLGTGTKGFDVIDMATYLLKHFGGLRGIATSGLRELSSVKGIGLKKAIKIKTSFEIGRRAITSEKIINHIGSPEAVWKLLLPETAGLEKEQFYVVMVNNKNHLLKKSLISVGTISQTIVHPREVFRDAIREGATSIIIAHNHPSGSVIPSDEDIMVTERLIETGKILGIPVVDHVIVADSKFCSMKERGYL